MARPCRFALGAGREIFLTGKKSFRYGRRRRRFGSPLQSPAPVFPPPPLLCSTDGEPAPARCCIGSIVAFADSERRSCAPAAVPVQSSRASRSEGTWLGRSQPASRPSALPPSPLHESHLNFAAPPRMRRLPSYILPRLTSVRSFDISGL